MSNPRIPCGLTASEPQWHRPPAAPGRPGPYQVEPPTAVQPPVRPAPDRPGDRGQQQAAEVARRYDLGDGIATAIAGAIAAARAEEAARWQAKIEALEQQMQRRSYRCTWQHAAADVRRLLLDGER